MSLIRPNFMVLIFNQSSSLVTLNLKTTFLSGNLKKSFLCLPNIQELDMSSNDNLEGQLSELSCSTSLRILDLPSCQLKGPIPLFFSNFTYLTSLRISRNNLNGAVPSSLWALTNCDIKLCLSISLLSFFLFGHTLLGSKGIYYRHFMEFWLIIMSKLNSILYGGSW
jgi:hypothetical protein